MNKRIFNLYWTGGFDSTFRLCEMLLIENKIVQPYYIRFELDNDKDLIEKFKSKLTKNEYANGVNPDREITVFFRNNRKQELSSMKNIIDYLKKKYPEQSKNLLSIKYIDSDITDKEFNLNFNKVFYKDNLFPEKRKIHQYYYLFKYAYYHKLEIDIGVLGIHRDKKFNFFLENNLDLYEELNSCTKNLRIPFKEHYMYYINYPLFNRTKEELLETSIYYKFDKILYLSWSCWFPNPITKSKCNKCPMCKERII